jgi:hypothetical protein
MRRVALSLLNWLELVIPQFPRVAHLLQLPGRVTLIARSDTGSEGYLSCLACCHLVKCLILLYSIQHM